MDQIQIGHLALSAFLTLILGVVYQFFQRNDGSSSLTDVWKTRITILAGIGTGIFSLVYNNVTLTTVAITNGVIAGLQIGCASIGIWKGLGAVNSAGVSVSARITARSSPSAIEKWQNLTRKGGE